jgi:hypothetical protein
MPLTSLLAIDFSLGSTKYLADLTPMRQSVQTPFDFAVDLPLDKVLGAGPSQPVNIPGKAVGPSLRFVGSSEATYLIPEAFTRFMGSVELRPPGEKFTPCRVQVFLEGKLLWDQQLTEAQAPLDFDLPVQEDQRLRLVVSAASSVATGDVVVWREARLLK